MSDLEKPIPEPMFIPNPIGEFIANQYYIAGCDLAHTDSKKWYEKHNTDCYFYSEEQDMHASIPCCGYHHYFYEDFDCSGCHAYVMKATVSKLVRSLVDNGEFNKEEK